MTAVAVDGAGGTSTGQAGVVADRWPGSGLATQVFMLTARAVRPLRQPGMVFASLIEPLIILLLFGGVFQVLGTVPSFPDGVDYIDYLMPAVLVIATLTNGVNSGTALINDLRNGMITRLRAMPIRLLSVLLARSFADSVRALSQLVLISVLSALIFGFAPPGGLLGTLGAVLIAVLIGWTISWVFITLAAVLRNGQILTAITTVVTFPLMFASNAFITLEALPGWLRVIAEVNPVSHAISTARDAALGTVQFGQVLQTMGICLLAVTLLATIANRAFKRP
ncbi:ABC transporter permease [Amycolatopsis aidingensis]|uniref:ABC transporter permease n=1 Tax=Amycolatopsis aidingensis TaxID=2842453 RepID=UPI001C0E7330|nr:ABC transporter permease [Amycolatopsis aidingensis]